MSISADRHNQLKSAQAGEIVEATSEPLSEGASGLHEWPEEEDEEMVTGAVYEPDAETTTSDFFGIRGYISGVPLVSMDDVIQSGVFQVTYVPSQRRQIDPVTGDTQGMECRSQIEKIPVEQHPENWVGHHRAPWDLDGFQGIMESDR